MAATLDEILDRIAEIKAAAAAGELDGRPAWPMLILRTPKGWTCPAEIDGHPAENNWRSHQVPLANARDTEAHTRLLESWLASYRPEELFDEQGRPIELITGLAPEDAPRRLTAMVEAMVADRDQGIEVLGGWSPSWAGSSIDAAGVPTRWGRVSFALRWHGERPALLWEVEPWEPGGLPPLRTASPVIDPTWSSLDAAGEAVSEKRRSLRRVLRDSCETAYRFNPHSVPHRPQPPRKRVAHTCQRRHPSGKQNDAGVGSGYAERHYGFGGALHVGI